MSRRLINCLACVALLGSLGGCTVFPNPEPPRVMDLTVPEPEFRATQTLPFSLRVDTPYASAPINSNRILIKPTPREFQIYEQVRWRDTAPVIIRDTLVSTIRASRGFDNVISDTNPADADRTLITELSAFQAETGGDGVNVVIQLHGQVVDNRSRGTLCSKTFRVERPSAGTGIERVVEAFSVGGEALASAMARWISACDGDGA